MKRHKWSGKSNGKIPLRKKQNKPSKKYIVEERYNFIETDIKWIRYEPKHKMLALNKV